MTVVDGVRLCDGSVLRDIDRAKIISQQAPVEERDRLINTYNTDLTIKLEELMALYLSALNARLEKELVGLPHQ